MEESLLGLGIVGIVIALIIFIVYIWSIFWSYKDAERRGKPGWLVAIVVAFLAWPIGLILWLVVRPSDSSYSRPH
ncbi:hypothetical protein [Pontibacter akesuensis]|uniref:Phospholipase_D-nuclease N-terminal n=1 Tax=Pontibacter akesuensis TaxID=388950 RepID=A0A1I7KFT6_9BACT|nr:hypothetical protein [Pontibacter akesuensis]GHA79458.1 hypothetical protein GCM10007389_37050 [Pontibacter akesuensis]SFU96317.1 hypothetical protein SAMN04487941_3683 [Pontibacter akesuensis]